MPFATTAVFPVYQSRTVWPSENTPADEAHMFEPHYDRHVWLYRDNPNGVFAQFNPKVSCEHGDASARVNPASPRS